MSKPSRVSSARPGRLSVGGTTYRLTNGTAQSPATRPIVIGAGVAGLCSAIGLLECGLDPVVLEQRSGNKLEGGAGINCQAAAIDALATFGVPIETMKENGRVIKKQSYYTPDGRHVSSLDKSGKGDTPGQIGIHRATLVKLLLDVAKSREIDVLFKHHVSSIDQTSNPNAITVRSEIRSNSIPLIVQGSMVIGADGLNSLVRRHYITGNRDRDPQCWHGATHYRGVVENFPTFLDGSTMILAGGVKGVKAVVYPISNPKDGTQTINWVLAVEEDAISEDEGSYKDHILKLIREQGFNLGFLDVEDLISKTTEVMAWPMVDLDPLDTWTDSKIAIIGDAAHGMLPVGSGGAMAALLDAVALRAAFEEGLEAKASTNQILRDYESRRYKDASLHQGKCRKQPAENVVQEAMDKFPIGTDIPAEYDQRIRDIMAKIHNPQTFGSVEDLLILGVSKGIITKEQAEQLKSL
eukprot:CAMPEP_0183702994 /NCGR_PEP_ID=MMETSP0737-20130205/905_1 /TAXON_ID=385413 /ORGANISM="Thalassiosira miniscula, Strain CCMP1093" /LENGTH=466 /DNA_ID=CAMNT_0025929689 /DNA_START=195 /DNA_END=1595 /DNA_ORIENTATION=-